MHSPRNMFDDIGFLILQFVVIISENQNNKTLPLLYYQQHNII